MSEAPLVRIHDVNKYYGQNHVLKNINLSVNKGEVIILLGPSGSGKSTLCRTINRLETTSSGTITIDGKDLPQEGRDLAKLRAEVGMVFQQPNPFPKSIYDNIAYGPRTHGIKDSQVLDEIVENSLKGAAIWDMVKDKLHSNATELSGGQQQRICIARAIANDPEVLLMDEPTSALDPISTNKIEDLIQELKDRYAIVIVTHNMQQAARISDKTAFFLSGEVVEFGDTAQIFTDPHDQRTNDYISGRFG